MSKSVCKIELDGKVIFSKPLVLSESLDSIREIIKYRVQSSFIFLDQEKNNIEKSDENDFKLEDIVKEKIVRLKSEDSGSNVEKNDSNGSEINIFEGNKKLCSINGNPKIKLDETRKLINAKIKDDFIFLDPENDIEKDDEKDFPIEDILQDQTIKIRFKEKKKVKKI